MEAALILFGVFGVLLLIGAPIMAALGASAMAVYIYNGENFTSLVELGFNAIDSFPILALPAFILSGALMSDAGISRRLIVIAESLAGRSAGGLGASTILACIFFGAISGSGPATTAAVGMLMIPAMVDRGYPRPYAAAVTSSAGGLGVVIPPSIPMVIYGVTATVSIPGMFVAGVVPGMMLAGALGVTNYLLSRRHGYRSDLPHRVPIGKALRDGVWSLLAPVVILGGIYSGMFTPTEAAVVSVFNALFVGVVIHRESSFRGFTDALASTTWLTGRVLIIMFAATAFGRILVENQIPAMIAAGILDLTDSLWLIWLVVILFLLIVGMFMETLATILIVTPVLLPVMTQFGVDPIHFGIILVVCCEIGFSTPPLGENLFIASSIAKTTIEEISVRALWFIATAVAVVVVLAFVPEITLWLPRMLGY